MEISSLCIFLSEFVSLVRLYTLHNEGMRISSVIWKAFLVDALMFGENLKKREIKQSAITAQQKPLKAPHTRDVCLVQKSFGRDFHIVMPYDERCGSSFSSLQ